MIFLDAYALVALVLDEPAADDVERLLREDETAVVVVNLAEAIDVTQRIHGAPAGEVRVAIEPLFLRTTGVVAPTERHAWRAAELRLRYYDRRTRPLSLADCFLLAAASPGDGIATSDRAVADVCRNEAVSLRGLPDTAGRLP